MAQVDGKGQEGGLPPAWEKNYPAGLAWNECYHGQHLFLMFRRAAERFEGRACTSFMGQAMSYGQIAARVEQMARGLAALGVRPGDRVGLMMPNCPDYVIFYYAILRCRAVVVNFNPLYSRREIRHQVNDSGTKVMVTVDLALTIGKLMKLIGESALERVIAADFAARLPLFKSLAFRLFKRRQIYHWRGGDDGQGALMAAGRLAGMGGKLPPLGRHPEKELAVLQYTGGTTGRPKGAMLTHANLSVNAAQLASWAPMLREGEERIMAILPFFHVFAMTTILNYGISRGAELILMPKFELEAALKLIGSARPTIMPGVPTLFGALANYPAIGQYDLSSLKFCISGGATLPEEIRRRFEQIAGCDLIEGYGLSETSPVLTANPIKGERRNGSIGLPLPATRISIRSPDDPARELAPGQKGEICAAGPQVMKGYWRNEGRNRQAFIGEYFRTGDIGYMDEDGFVYLSGRIKDMINASGFKIWPQQIEKAIRQMEEVGEVVVIGIPDDYRGEAPKAFIRVREGMSLSANQVMDFLRPRLSKLEMPAAIEFRDELPKTMIGKPSRKQLQDDEKAAAGEGSGNEDTAI